MVPVLRPVVNQHFHVIRLTSCGLFVRCMSLVLADFVEKVVDDLWEQ